MDKVAVIGESRSNVIAVIPEASRWLMERLASHFRKSEGEHARRADEMMSRAEQIRSIKTEKAPMSPGLEKAVSSLEATQVEQAVKIAALEAYIQKMGTEAKAAAQIVGGTKLEAMV